MVLGRSLLGQGINPGVDLALEPECAATHANLARELPGLHKLVQASTAHRNAREDGTKVEKLTGSSMRGVVGKRRRQAARHVISHESPVGSALLVRLRQRYNRLSGL